MLLQILWVKLKSSILLLITDNIKKPSFHAKRCLNSEPLKESALEVSRWLWRTTQDLRCYERIPCSTGPRNKLLSSSSSSFPLINSSLVFSKISWYIYSSYIGLFNTHNPPFCLIFFLRPLEMATNKWPGIALSKVPLSHQNHFGKVSSWDPQHQTSASQGARKLLCHDREAIDWPGDILCHFLSMRGFVNFASLSQIQREGFLYDPCCPSSPYVLPKSSAALIQLAQCPDMPPVPCVRTKTEKQPGHFAKISIITQARFIRNVRIIWTKKWAMWFRY